MNRFSIVARVGAACLTVFASVTSNAYADGPDVRCGRYLVAVAEELAEELPLGTTVEIRNSPGSASHEGRASVAGTVDAETLKELFGEDAFISATYIGEVPEIPERPAYMVFADNETNMILRLPSHTVRLHVQSEEPGAPAGR